MNGLSHDQATWYFYYIFMAFCNIDIEFIDNGL